MTLSPTGTTLQTSTGQTYQQVYNYHTFICSYIIHTGAATYTTNKYEQCDIRTNSSCNANKHIDRAEYYAQKAGQQGMQSIDTCICYIYLQLYRQHMPGGQQTSLSHPSSISGGTQMTKQRYPQTAQGPRPYTNIVRHVPQPAQHTLITNTMQQQPVPQQPQLNSPVQQ
jgi:hypothetical protein